MNIGLSSGPMLQYVDWTLALTWVLTLLRSVVHFTCFVYSGPIVKTNWYTVRSSVSRFKLEGNSKKLNATPGSQLLNGVGENNGALEQLFIPLTFEICWLMQSNLIIKACLIVKTLYGKIRSYF